MTRERIGRWLCYGIATAPHWVIPWTLYPSGFGKVPLLLPAVWILALLALLGWKREPARRNRWLLIGVGAYLAAYAVAAAFGVDGWKSVWGEQSRQNGLVILAHLALFAFLLPSFLRTAAQWRMFDRWLFWPGVAAAAVVIVEALIPGVAAAFGETGRYAAWFGNPLFFGGYAALVTFVGVRLLPQLRGAERAAAAVGIALLAVGVVLSGSRGPALALAAGGAVFLAAGGWRLAPRSARGTKAALAAGGAAVIVAVALLVAAQASGFYLGRIFSASFYTLNVAPRLIQAGVAWDGFLERPLTGWGPENFQTVFDRKYDPEILRHSFYESVSDKPHSLPMEILATGGVVLALGWLLFLGALLRAAWDIRRTADAPASAAVLGLVAAYLVHTLTLFDVLSVSIVLFATVGYAMAHAAPVPTPRPHRAVGALALAALAAADLFLIVPTMGASGAVARAFEAPDVPPAQWTLARARAEAAGGPYRVEFAKTLALDFIRRDGRGDWPADAFAAEAPHIRRFAESAVAEKPDDHLLVFFLGQIYGIEGEYARSAELLAEAERTLARAAALSPGRQAVPMQLAKIHLLQGDAAKAVAVMEELVVTDPTLPDPQWFLGLAHAAAGNPAQASDAFVAAMRGGRMPHTGREAEYVIDVLAAAERYDDIVPVYQFLISLQPQEGVWHARLAATYAAAGKLELAVIEAQRAAELNPAFAEAARQFQEMLTRP